MNEHGKRPQRRLNPRASKNLLCRFRVYKGADYKGGWQEASLTKNVSVSGCYVTAVEAFQAGDFIEIEFRVPFSTHKIQFIAEITRVDQHRSGERQIFHGYGVHFVKMKEIDKAKQEEFARFVEKLVYRQLPKNQ